MGIDNLFDSETVLGVNSFPVLGSCGTDDASISVAEQNSMKGKLHSLFYLGHGVVPTSLVMMLFPVSFSTGQCDISSLLLKEMWHRIFFIHFSSANGGQVHDICMVCHP